MKGVLYNLNLETYELSKKIIDTICNKKVVKVDLLDVGEVTSLAEAFIIAVASNTKQTQAMTDDIEEKLIQDGVYTIRKEGYQTANWILLDYGNIIVHILDQEHATFYSLNRLWKDAKCVESF